MNFTNDTLLLVNHTIILSANASEHEVADAIASLGWAGIPFNISLNIAIFTVSMALFTYLRQKANSDRSKNMRRFLKGWVQFLYADREPQSTAREPHPYVESHEHDNRYPGLLFSPSILKTLNIEQEEVRDEHSIDRKEFLENIEVVDSDDDDFERRERKADHVHRYVEDIKADTKIPLIQSGNWLLDMYLIRDSDILQMKGRDAVQYLTFQRYIIYFLLILTILSLFVILPINLQGNKMHEGDYFLTTTIWNLEAKSDLIWVHVLMGIILYPIGAFLMWRFSIMIRADEEFVCRRTLFIRRIPKWLRSKQMLIGFLHKKVPDIKISAIQLVYDIRTISNALLEHHDAVHAKYYCEDYLVELGNRFEGRPHILGKFGGILCCCLCCPKIDGIHFYRRRQKILEQKIEQEYEKCIVNPKGAVFVTFETEEMANKVESFINAGRKSWCLEFFFRVVTCLHNCCRRTNDVNVHTWSVRHAPFPEDINWPVVALDLKVLWTQRIVVHLFLLVIFFFFSTPSILLQWVETQVESQSFIKTIKNSTPTLGAYVEALTLVIVGTMLPTFVYMATIMLPHTTVSSRNHSVMVKIFLFLVMMIVILPSLGYTSTLNLVQRVVDNNGTVPWTNMITGTGSLFTNYIIQSALLSPAMELLRVSEVFAYFIYLLLFSSTIAEYEGTRRNIIYEFQFGILYAKIMLIVFIVVAYSITCPLIVPFGLLYMVIKHAVDRYNIYFIYDASRIDIRIHSTAIIFFHISLMAMQVRLLSTLWIIGQNEITNTTSILSVAFFIEAILFCIQFCNRYFYGLFSFTRRQKTYFQEWCACSYIPSELQEATTRGLVPLDMTSVTNQMKAVKVLDNPSEEGNQTPTTTMSSNNQTNKEKH